VAKLEKLTSHACRANRDLSNGVKNPKPEVDWDRTFLHGTLDMQIICTSLSLKTPCQHHITQCFTHRMPFLTANQQCQSTESKSYNSLELKQNQTRMWANAQRDGRPAEYRWHTLFNAAKFGWCPLLECHAVTLPRRETHWNLQGCPKLTNGSQPLVGRSAPYYQDTWRRYCCLTSFSDCQYMP